jgi:hypothetical protein
VNVLSLFAGIGGLELGLERAGMTVVGQVELDPFCRRVLAKHWPEVPRHDDVRTCVDWWRREPRPPVHVVAGGFPCQPVSEAGRKLAQADARWLWPEMAKVIRAIRPVWVIGELGLDTEPAPELSQLVRWAPHTHASACSSWPTPLASDADKGGLRPWSCRKRLDGGHTPHLNEALGGPTNPRWLEWFMGFPDGLTELEPSETPSFPRSPSTSDG